MLRGKLGNVQMSVFCRIPDTGQYDLECFDLVRGRQSDFVLQ
ncbi:hypothetical protein Bra471DRAFT_01397 [Bradyrhizobium sp. WSM471]|nr:hypothetical protein Bra471DRAFT_01397 [Bradyrhizobium sp. WSM471]